MKRTLVIAVFLFATVASAKDDVAKAIEANSEAFQAEMNAGNADGYMAFYADDAVILPTNAPAIAGSAEIRKFWAAVLGPGKSDVDLITEHVESSGDLAVERGRYEVTTPFKDSGKYIVVWQKRGGKWRIIDDMFSTNLPPPTGH